MITTKSAVNADLNAVETSEWLEALDEVIADAGPERASFLLSRLMEEAATHGVTAPLKRNTQYLNTIPVSQEVAYPGDRAMEESIKKMLRWNAMAMVVRANKYDDGIGGHISTYASLATILEVGFNHFFRGSYGDQPGDFVYFQGHASPGVYARAFLEGRLSEQHLVNFRHELRETPGVSSYPHPWLMPDFWQFPTVSMGLGPINAIYHARFMRYLENRGIIPKTDRKIYAFLGDGETDEPESLGALTLASREKLDNLIFVVNCNLQRLDGPVRGNGSIVQELEAVFHGAGWNVLKVLWGSEWDKLFAQDQAGLLAKRMAECVDGEYQNFKARGAAYVRKEFFGKHPELAAMVAGWSDDDISRLNRGGHDEHKMYQAYKRATETKGMPTVILAKTIKGYGLGEVAEGKNATHQQKKLNEEELEYVVRRFGIDLPDDVRKSIGFYRPPDDSPEMKYMHERRRELGGYLPQRKYQKISLPAPPLDTFKDMLGGSKDRAASTTSAYVTILRALLKEETHAKYIVPIIPDEARTFGMESLFRQIGIYASQGQLYTPVDSDMFLYYKESKDGQILQEGITEMGSMASMMAAGTSYANYGVPMIPFYSYYSMFGYQRVGDNVWAFADSRGHGFLMGGTAGRTTLLGEGLQHQDGQSPLQFAVVPNCIIYDPAYAYEMAVVIRDGLRRMYEKHEDCFYYITMYNENYVQPPMPEGVEEGILRGVYRYKAAPGGKAVVHLWGSGPMVNEALRAQQILHEKYGVEADVWSVTSYNELRKDALEAERWNRLHPDQPQRRPYVQQVLDGHDGPIVSSSEYMKALADQLSPWLPGRLETLGTDGFGRSENRAHLRRFFEIDGEHIVAAALSKLSRWNRFDGARAAAAIRELGLNPEIPNPVQR